ncbi:condensation domain-containing protein, partial [Micromonospora sp. DT178]|uniref:condensation domain-containing protein n=1 Tax=Micromonospora sp. DT178 TaxID=3393436 RepID=UPI003CF35CAD
MIADSVHERFEAQARLTPDAVALVGDGADLSYGALNAAANRLAHELIGRGARAGRTVLLALPRDARLVVAALAVLKSGGAYLLIEQDRSADHVAQLVQAAGPALALGLGDSGSTAQACAAAGVSWLDTGGEELRAGRAALPEHNPPNAAGGDAAACLIAPDVSGDRPGIVVLSHGEFADLLGANGPGTHSSSALTRAEVPAADLLAPLLTGAAVRLVPAPRGQADGAAEATSAVTPAHGEGDPVPPPLVPGPRPPAVPVSFEQRRFWFLHQMEGPQRTHLLPIVYRLRGPLDVGTLRAGLGDLVARHEVLRTVLRETDGEPVQVVLPGAAVPVEELTCTEADLPQAVERASEHVFDLSRDVPLRATVISVGPADHVLVLLLHQIACDPGSQQPLIRDLSVAYGARLEGGVPGWAPLPVQYG